MDPGFLFVSIDFLQQQQLARAEVERAQQEYDEAVRQAMLFEHRKKMLASAQEESNVLVHNASVFPERAFVESQLILFSLDCYGVIPDSFEDQKEKEEVILLWRKLLNVADKSKTLMTVEQFERCKECLEAISTQSLIRASADRLEAYKEFQRIKPKLESLRKKSQQLVLFRKISWIVIGFIAMVTFPIYVSRVGFAEIRDISAVWILTSLALGIITHLVAALQQPKDIKEVESLFHALSNEAGIEDTGFWQAVNDKFGGIPTIDQLRQCWNEQEIIISTILGEPEANPSVDSP
ncbi:MAG TPA: hypothetical protein PKH77_27395 [Anaerolineae bacterium]|nr:hypothetical protein [Anaerolineae bacterium]